MFIIPKNLKDCLTEKSWEEEFTIYMVQSKIVLRLFESFDMVVAYKFLNDLAYSFLMLYYSEFWLKNYNEWIEILRVLIGSSKISTANLKVVNECLHISVSEINCFWEMY